MDDTAIAAGVADVTGTPFDFRTGKTLGRDIGADNMQLRQAGGYDHHFILENGADELHHAATLSGSSTGRQMQVWTTENGVQLYSGNFLSGSFMGWDGARYEEQSAVCLETQQAPDTVNQPELDRLSQRSIIVNPGQRYHTCIQ